MLRLNPQNIEEYILLYHDQELNTTEQNAVENYIAQHKEAQKLFDEYAQCKLHPENEIFQEVNWSYLRQPEVLQQRKTTWRHLNPIRNVAAALTAILCLSTIYFINHNVADHDLNNIIINIPIPEVKPIVEKEQTTSVVPISKTNNTSQTNHADPKTKRKKSTLKQQIKTENKPPTSQNQQSYTENKYPELTAIASSKPVPVATTAKPLKVSAISIDNTNSLPEMEEEDPLIVSPINNKGVKKIVNFVTSIKSKKENLTEQIKNIISTEKIIEL